MNDKLYLYSRPAAGRLRRRLLLFTVATAAVLTIALATVDAQQVIVNTNGLLTQPSPGPAPKPVERLRGNAITPASSVVKAADTGKFAHTNVRFVEPDLATPMEAPPYSGYAYETPASLACVYSLVTTIAGCNPNSTVNDPTGGSQTIAIVDAYDDPEAAPDLAYFSDQFGLPFKVSQFQVVYASGFAPPVDYTGGWELEESLDVEYAHAMAPNAKIYLVEANSNSFTDLFTAVTAAANLVRCGSTATCPTTATGKGEVSMSWGGAEFSGETTYDSTFLATNVVFLAAAGDSPGVIYPAASPNVISVGGTSIARSPYNGNLNTEIAWSDAGGGPSSYEVLPAYQGALATLVGTHRATPDVAAVANPYTGVWVYNTFPQDGYYSSSGWWIVGGTSVATPVWAGIINAADTTNGFAASSAAELTTLYGDLASTTNYPLDFKDVTYGACYFYSGYFTRVGYDFCTGIGSPKTYAGK